MKLTEKRKSRKGRKNPIRKKKYTGDEKKLCLNLIAREKILWSKTTKPTPHRFKKEAWDRVCQTYNNAPGVFKRTLKQLKQFWNNVKKKYKQQIALQNQKALKNGDDDDDDGSGGGSSHEPVNLPTNTVADSDTIPRSLMTAPSQYPANSITQTPTVVVSHPSVLPAIDPVRQDKNGKITPQNKTFAIPASTQSTTVRIRRIYPSTATQNQSTIPGVRSFFCSPLSSTTHDPIQSLLRNEVPNNRSEGVNYLVGKKDNVIRQKENNFDTSSSECSSDSESESETCKLLAKSRPENKNTRTQRKILMDELLNMKKKIISVEHILRIEILKQEKKNYQVAQAEKLAVLETKKAAAEAKKRYYQSMMEQAGKS